MNATRLTRYAAAEIRAEMARQRVTQIHMAAMLGMSQPALSRLLRADRPLTVDFIADCAAALDVPISQLLGPVDDLTITPVSAESSMLGVA